MRAKNKIVKDYTLYDNSGKETMLSELFDDRDGNASRKPRLVVGGQGKL